MVQNSLLQRISILSALAAVGAVAQTSQTVTYSYSGEPLPITYTTSNVFTIAQVLVPVALNVTKVTVQVQVDYPQVGDLNVFFYSALGTRTKLLQKNCGNLQNIDTTFDDSASTKFSSFCPAEAGRGPFAPNEPLANSNGESSFGVWRLAVQNNTSSGNFGTLRAVTVNITGVPFVGPTISADAIVGAASFLPGSVAPGERIIIYGAGLGPATAVSAPAGDLPSTLGGTAVVIDGVAAAISYASARRVDVVVPYGEIPGTNALITAGYQGRVSNTVVLGVRTARPGIYLSGESGNHASAINQDGTVNAPDNPAPAGSYLTFYAGGLGITNPLISSGVVAPSSPLYNAFYPILAYVGENQATVAFAGLAPGLIGVYQVNVLVPPSTPSGPQDLRIIAVNGASSQDGVQVDIK